MTTLNNEIIHKLMELSRIDCTEGEQESLQRDLTEILDYVELLQEVDTTNVKPCNHVLANIYNAMRDDVVGETISRDDFINNAPEHVGGMIRVPPIIKQRG